MPETGVPSAATDPDQLLAELGLPEHAPVEQLRALARVAATACATPTAVINLLGSCFQHQVGEIGFAGGGTPLSESMCHLANRLPHLRHVVDASREPAFSGNPWVDGRRGAVRFYASAPLVLTDGRTIGALCVFDVVPRELSEAQRQALHDLAGQAVFLLEQNHRARESARRAALFRLVAEGSADVLSRHRPDGTMVYVSPSLRNVLGHDPATETGTSGMQRIHPQDSQAMHVAMTAVGSRGRPEAGATVRAQHADGTWRWLEIRLAPIHDDDGAVVEVHSVARDVTERVAALHELSQVAERSRSIVDTCADAFVAVDAHGLVLDWNPAACEIFGWSREEALGRQLEELIVPVTLREQHQQGMARLREGAGGRLLGQRVQVPAQRRNGDPLPVELTIWRSRSEAGDRYNAFLRDVSERAHHQQELAAARDDAERRAALTEAVLDTIDVAVVACDADGRLTLFNRAAREFHGGAADPSVDPQDSAAHYNLLDEHGRTLERDQVPLLRALTEGELHDATIVIAPPDLPARIVRCDGRAMRDSDGRLLGAVVAQKDVTEARAQASELVQARDQALASTRAKTAFLAAASHEIRTPLNGVLGTLELLGLQPLTAQQREYVQIARASGDALLRLLNDVLDLSKAETTSVSLSSVPFRPRDVADEVVAALQPVALRKGIHLSGTGPRGAAAAVVGDPARVRQVVMNLVGNAVKFTRSGEVTVGVSTEPVDDEVLLVRLTVSDTGAGIAPEELGSLFQPFAQGQQGAQHGGTGLGLALSQQLVELMGGRITVDSRPGVGSTFVVELRLPAAVTVPAPRPTSSDDEQPAPRGAGLRVLVADDSDVNLMVAEALLVAGGAAVTCVRDGDEALAAVQQDDFDLVLLDNRMVRMSGLAAAGAIRQLPGRAGRTRLLLVTASVSDEERAACAAHGVDEVVLKPMTLTDVHRVLRAAEPAAAS